MNLADRPGLYRAAEFADAVFKGRGRMPAFPDIDSTTLNAILTFLGNAGGRAEVAAKSPAVVASGGAPGGLDLLSGLLRLSSFDRGGSDSGGPGNRKFR
jgi:hypothetical protein